MAERGLDAGYCSGQIAAVGRVVALSPKPSNASENSSAYLRESFGPKGTVILLSESQRLRRRRATCHTATRTPRPNPLRLTLFTMPVTFTVATHNASSAQRPEYRSAEEILNAACSSAKEHIEDFDVLQSSVNPSEYAAVQPSPNGFVHTVLEAYGQHRNLIIRSHPSPPGF